MKILAFIGASAVALSLTFLVPSGCNSPPVPTVEQTNDIGVRLESARGIADSITSDPKSSEEDIKAAKDASAAIVKLESELAELNRMMAERPVDPEVESIADSAIGFIPEPYRGLVGLGLAAVGGVAAIRQRQKWGGAFVALVKSIERAKATSPLLARAFDANKNAIKANLNTDVQALVDKVRVESGKVSFVPPAPPGTPTTPDQPVG